MPVKWVRSNGKKGKVGEGAEVCWVGFEGGGGVVFGYLVLGSLFYFSFSVFPSFIFIYLFIYFELNGLVVR